MAPRFCGYHYCRYSFFLLLDRALHDAGREAPRWIPYPSLYVVALGKCGTLSVSFSRSLLRFLLRTFVPDGWERWAFGGGSACAFCSVHYGRRVAVDSPASGRRRLCTCLYLCSLLLRYDVLQTATLLLWLYSCHDVFSSGCDACPSGIVLHCCVYLPILVVRWFNGSSGHYAFLRCRLRRTARAEPLLFAWFIYSCCRRG